MTIKNEVLIRVYVVLFLLVLAAVVIFSKAVRIHVYEGEKWRRQADEEFIDIRSVEAERGNILTEDGRMLATSLPFFDIAFDPVSSGMKEEDFVQNIDSLSYCLATYVDNTYTPGGFKEYLMQERRDSNKYVLLKKGATFREKEIMSRFPLFNKGQFEGGFIAKPYFKRARPFGLMARRTIGYVRDNAKPVGLEGYFDETLAGQEGRQMMLMVDRANETWIPIENLTRIEPERGDDIVTTLDMEMQAITEDALLHAMNYHNAEWGTAVVMEVATGKIRSIANLGRTEEGWWETYNYAVGTAVEPGSVFKLATIMALLEDGYVNLQDTVHLKGGRTTFYDEEVIDAVAHGLDTATIQQAFEQSSNVGMARLVDKYYGDALDSGGEGPSQAEQFIERLKKFKLHLPTGIEIEGEARPLIKEAYSVEDDWSGTTLPWMSFGYEVMLTPLQLLTFYNAVANGGQMMKPYLVTEVQNFGETLKEFRPAVIDRQIASEETIQDVQGLLRGVVERGTAYKLTADEPPYTFAGKTGTAQIDYQRLKNRTRIGGYQATFAGYFPAENPVYSCIVVINNPREHGFYGGDVAGPVFREIADKAFASRIELHRPVNVGAKPTLVENSLPDVDIGAKADVEQMLQFLDMPYADVSSTEWIVLRATERDSVKLFSKNFTDTQVPNVIGLGLRDAVYVLENRNLKVVTEGVGRVVLQSIRPGTPTRGQQIKLTLR